MPENTTIPTCVGIILDGNRRWAKERGLPTLEGHKKGAETFAETVRWLKARGIQQVVVYALSTENLKRTQDEVGYLMNLIREAAKTQLKDLAKEGVCVRVAGDRSRLPSDIQELIVKTERESAENTLITVWLCLAYGGRAEIVAAANEAIERGEKVTEETFQNYLWTADMPDPDLIIRTGGQKRLSGFLPWQGTYSELFFVDEYWPAFTEAHLDAVLAEFAARKRNFGK
jgi:undecaprenyl diphosphate synthase